MRIAPAAATLLAILSLTGAALACKPSPRPTFTPVITDPGNGDRGAQRLLRAAAEADAQANREEIAARNADRRADSFEVSADSAFERAAFTEGFQRTRLLAEGRSFEDAAIRARAEADRGFQRAAQNRRRARELRLQANNLAGGGGGWRGRPVRQVDGGQFL